MKNILGWKVFRFGLLGLLVIFLAIQFVPVARTNPAIETELPAPPEVRAILKRSCYDCHSNETVWPWYSRVAPVSWLISRDVRDGRRELNFSTWNQYSDRKQAKKLEECWEQVEKGEMPLWFYIPLHRDAKLSSADRELLRKWTAEAQTKTESGGAR